MSMAKADRRAGRTRELLQNALVELVREGSYDAITIQDIVDRASLGRTTFYLHYKGKDELLVSCHEAIVNTFQIGPRHALSREELLSAEPPEGVLAAFRHLEEARGHLYSVFQGRDSALLLRRMRDRRAKDIEANVRAAFPGADPRLSLELLALYIAGAQIALLQWWLEKRRRHTIEDLAQTFHRLQRAAVLEVFGGASK